VEDRDKVSELSGEIRRVIEGIAIPQDINPAFPRTPNEDSTLTASKAA